MSLGVAASNAGPGRPLIEVRSLVWEIPDGTPILDRLSLSLSSKRYGLVGSNGSGKTTLVRLIVGSLRPSAGHVRTHCSIGYVPQTIATSEAGSVRALLTEGPTAGLLGASDPMSDSSPWAQDASGFTGRKALILGKLGLSNVRLDQPVSSLSGGEVTLVALASVVMREPEFLVLDEPTNNLDAHSKARLREFLRQWKGGVLLVSHDRELLEDCEQILDLHEGQISEYGGGFAAYLAMRNEEEAAAIRQVHAAAQALRVKKNKAQQSYERQQRRAATGARRRPNAGQAKIILGVWEESSQKTGARLAAVNKKRVTEAALRLSEARGQIRSHNRLRLCCPAPNLPAGKKVLELKDVSKSFSERAVLDHINLAISGPERVLLSGANGTGKTTLIKILSGDLNADAGTVEIGVSHVGYVPQSGFRWAAGDTVLGGFARRTGRELGDAREQLSRLLFTGSTVFRSINDLSGGERVRLALGAVLMNRNVPQLLLIDEPTNNLDLDSIEQVESMLADYEGAIVVASHDRHFVNAIGIDREIVLRSNHAP